MDVPISVWGSATWRTLHSICLGFDQRHRGGALSDADRQAARNLIESLEHLLPCSACRTSLAALMASVDLRASLTNAIADGALLPWSVQLHNLVNAKLGKPAISSESAAAELRAAGGGLGLGAHDRGGLKPSHVLAAVAAGLGIGVVVYTGMVCIKRAK